MKTIRHFTENTFNLKKIVFLFSLLFTTAFYCQTPNLGATSTFAIFSAAGAIDNVGASTITGDVGTNVGAFNGFPPGTIDGNIHVADAVSAQAAIDVDLLYSYFVGLSCDSTISSTLGNNQNLVANTYCISTASSLNDTLILDGQNNSNAQFIFKINGAFTTSVYSTIVLINQAQAKNVYWQVNGLFNLGDNSQFKGTMITDGANSLLTNSSVEGRILSRAGAISLASNVVIMNFGGSPLPIELLSFSVECQQLKGLVKWSTASESNNDYFTIEKSNDLENWQEIATIDGAGNSTSLINYTFEIENQLNEKSGYYRLKQTDFNGQYSYSDKHFFQFCSDTKINLIVFPNPVKNKLQFRYDENLEELISIKIYPISGGEGLVIEKSDNEIDLSEMNSGVYFVKFKFKKSSIIKRIIISK
jgi:hypothetical protein